MGELHIDHRSVERKVKRSTIIMKTQLFVLFLTVAATMAFNVREDPADTTTVAPTTVAPTTAAPTTAAPTTAAATTAAPTTAAPTTAKPTTASPTTAGPTGPTTAGPTGPTTAGPTGTTASTDSPVTTAGASHGIASFSIIVACALAKFL